MLQVTEIVWKTDTGRQRRENEDNAFVRRCPFVNTLRRHHRAHHDQAIMMQKNMNLTFPIADWLFGTSDLDRGLLGHLFNGYDTRHVKPRRRRAAAA